VTAAPSCRRVEAGFENAGTKNAVDELVGEFAAPP